MARSFFRSVTDQFAGTNSKSTDTYIEQAICQFENEQGNLSKFKREFDKYTQAMLVFDNASYRFFDFIRTITDTMGSHQPLLVQTCIATGRIRGEHLHNLHKQITSSIKLSFDAFGKMKFRIDERNRLQHLYDKTRKQYQTSFRQDEQTKIDNLKNQLDQLQSAFNLSNEELRSDLPKFHQDIQNNNFKIAVELFGLHGKYYKQFYKLYSRFTKKFEENKNPNSNTNENNVVNSRESLTIDSYEKINYSVPIPQTKRKDYEVLHRARVIHDYKAEDEHEIDLVKDESINVISFNNEEKNIRDNGWDYGEKSDGAIGLFPVNFAKRVYENEK